MLPKSPNLFWEFNINFLPDDIALKVASFLQVSDLCSLSSCSRFWRNVCASDCIWISLSKQRWNSTDLLGLSTVLEKGDLMGLSTVLEKEFVGESEELIEPCLPTKGWRSFYIKWHKEMASRAGVVVRFVKQCSHRESLEVGDYLRAIALLYSMKLGFEDVQLFLFATKHSVLLNLIGLHYSLFALGISAEKVIGALSGCQISDRLVCIRWWMLGQWAYGFRQRDESRVRTMSLRELLKAEEEVLSVLRRGAVHEVLRVQISADLGTSTWTCKSMH